MAGFLSVAALLLVAGEVDVDATLMVETQAGEGPLRAPESPRAGVVGVLTPGADLEISSGRLDARLDYGVRLFWRQPNDSGDCPNGALSCANTARSSRLSPLVLHVGNFVGTARATPTLTLSSAVSVSVGEPDYATLPQLIGTVGSVPATLPAVVDIFSGTAKLGAEVRSSRMWVLHTSAELSHRRPLGNPIAPNMTDPAAPPTVLFPRQTIWRLEPGATAHLSRRDDLLLIGALSYQTYSTGSEFWTVTPEVGWLTLLSRQTSLRLIGGVTYLRTRGLTMGVATQVDRRPPPPLSPLGSVELVSHPMHGAGLIALAATVEYYVDPILVQAVPRGTATARCGLLFAPDWEAGIEAMFGTSLSDQPLTTPSFSAVPAPLPPDETVVSVSVPIRHRASHYLIVEFGGRWSDRAPHLRAQEFTFHQRQLWIYLNLTASTKKVPRWRRAGGQVARDERERGTEADETTPSPTPASVRSEAQRQGSLPDQR